jgi:hypothetical protein
VRFRRRDVVECLWDFVLAEYALHTTCKRGNTFTDQEMLQTKCHYAAFDENAMAAASAVMAAADNARIEAQNFITAQHNAMAERYQQYANALAAVEEAVEEADGLVQAAEEAKEAAAAVAVKSNAMDVAV